MIDADDTSVVKAMLCFLRVPCGPSGQQHYIAVITIGIKSVLLTVDVVCRIVDTKYIVLVNASTFEQYLVDIGFRVMETVAQARQGMTPVQFRGVHMHQLDARKEVMLQSRDEVLLAPFSRGQKKADGLQRTLIAGSFEFFRMK